MAQRNSVAKVTFPDDSPTKAQWKFTGQDAPVEVDVASFSPEMQTKLARHGLKQKLSDCYAGVKGNVEEAIKAFNENLENLSKGVWATRTAGEPRTSLLTEALARITGKTVEECQTVINTLGEQDEADEGDRIAKLRKHPQIALALAQIRVERATAAAEKEGAGDIGSLLQ